MPTYRLDILITGTDRASPRISGFGRALGRIGQIAAGILIAGAIRGITNQISNLASVAFDSISDIERMQIGMETLVARELARGQVIEETSTSIRTLTEAEILSLDKLTLEYFKLGEELAETETHYSDMIGEFGEGSMEVLAASIAVRDLKDDISETGSEMEALAALEGAVVSFTTQSRVGTMGLAEALGLAVGPAEKLLGWVTQIALQSPFGEEAIMDVLRRAAGYEFATQAFGGLVTEQERLNLAQEGGVVTAQRLTLAIIDFISAVGEPVGSLANLIRALGQVKGHGRLLGMEVRQLVNAGMTIDFMAMAMGMTADEFERARAEGEIFADEFIPALVIAIEEGLGGAAERLSKTLSGLKENFGDLRRVMLREMFGPLVYAIEPALLRFYEQMSSPENIVAMRTWGEGFRDRLIEIWEWLVTLTVVFNGINDFLKFPWVVLFHITPEHWDREFVTKIGRAIISVGDLKDAILEIDPPGEDLGFEQPENVLGGVLAGVGAVSAIGWIIRLGGVAISTLGWLAAGAGLAGIAAGTLGALWFGNFLGIRDITKDAWENYIKPSFMGIKKWLEEDAVLAIETFYEDWKQKVWQLWIDTKVWIDSDFIPSLIQIRDWIGTKLGEGAIIGAIALQTRLLPQLNSVYLKLKDDVIPQIAGFILHIGTKAAEALGTLTRPMRVLILEVLPDFAGVMWREVIPAVKELGSIWLANAAKSAGLFGKRMKQIAEPTLKEFGFALGMLVIPPLREFVDLVDNIYEKGAVGIRRGWEESIRPMLQGMATWLSEHVNPATEIFLDLWSEGMDILFRLVGGIWVNFALPILMGLWTVLMFWVNPALTGFVGLLELGLFLIGQFGSGVLKIIRKSVQGFAYAAGVAIDFLAGVLERLRDVLVDLADKLPWWALPGSPSYIEQVFLDTADAVEGLDGVLGRSSLFRPGGLNPNISSPMFAGGAAGAMSPASVVVEGDENTFVVTSEKLAEYVAHQLREEKVKRYNHYMGR